jgi:hypothetical protein
MKTEILSKRTASACIFIIMSTVMIFLISCNQQKGSSIDGAWDLVSIESFNEGKLVQQYPRDYNGSDMKIWSKGYFIFVGRFKSDTTFSDNYGGGTYKLDGNNYEETILYHTIQSWVNTKPKMILEIKDDTLYQTYPAGDDWKINPNEAYTIEKYIRLE